MSWTLQLFIRDKVVTLSGATQKVSEWNCLISVSDDSLNNVRNSGHCFFFIPETSQQGIKTLLGLKETETSRCYRNSKIRYLLIKNQLNSKVDGFFVLNSPTSS